MKVTVHHDPPLPPPPPPIVVTIELSLREAQLLRALLGQIGGGCGCPLTLSTKLLDGKTREDVVNPLWDKLEPVTKV